MLQLQGDRLLSTSPIGSHCGSFQQKIPNRSSGISVFEFLGVKSEYHCVQMTLRLERMALHGVAVGSNSEHHPERERYLLWTAFLCPIVPPSSSFHSGLFLSRLNKGLLDLGYLAINLWTWLRPHTHHRKVTGSSFSKGKKKVILCYNIEFSIKLKNFWIKIPRDSYTYRSVWHFDHIIESWSAKFKIESTMHVFLVDSSLPIPYS